MKNVYKVVIVYRDDREETLESLETPSVSGDWVRLFPADGGQIHIASASVSRVEITDLRIKK